MNRHEMKRYSAADMMAITQRLASTTTTNKMKKTVERQQRLRSIDGHTSSKRLSQLPTLQNGIALLEDNGKRRGLLVT